MKIFERSGAIFGRGLAVLIDLLNPERIIAGSVYARSHHFLDSAMYRELKKEALAPSLAACRILPAALGERIGDYAAISAAFGIKGYLSPHFIAAATSSIPPEAVFPFKEPACGLRTAGRFSHRKD